MPRHRLRQVEVVRTSVDGVASDPDPASGPDNPGRFRFAWRTLPMRFTPLPSRRSLVVACLAVGSLILTAR